MAPGKQPSRRFLPRYAKCTNFVNADLIAQGIAPLRPESASIRAGRLVLREIEQYRWQNVDFAFETTLSGRAHLRVIHTLKESGYAIHYFYLWLPTVELSLSRIAGRVMEGGHDVPSVDVRRRYERSLENFFVHYLPLADSCMVFDNAGGEPEQIALARKGRIQIVSEARFKPLASRYRNA